jgi:serine/threonine-protein kinase
MSGPGSALIELDPQGRLVRLEVIPDHQPQPPPEPSVDAVAVLLEHAGLERKEFTAAEPCVTPPVLCDDVHAFSGPYGAAADAPITVQVGSYRGRPNYFEIVNAWDAREDSDAASTVPLAAALIGIVLLITVNLIAYRNLAQNRCDRRGAFRLAVFTMLVWMLGWSIAELRIRGPLDDVAQMIGYVLFGKPFGHAIAHAFMAWIAYVALEPYARRLWPRTLVTWTRLLMGRFRDPQLGRDVLVGALVGCALVFLDHLSRFVLVQIGHAPPPPASFTVGGLRENLARLVVESGNAVSMPLIMLVLLVILRLVLRVNWAAMLGFILLLIVMPLLRAEASLDARTAVEAAGSAVFAAILLMMLLRYGACAGIAAWWVQTSLDSFAITPDLTQWYAAPALVSVLTCVVLLFYGFYASLAGQPIFKDTLAEPQPQG